MDPTTTFRTWRRLWIDWNAEKPMAMAPGYHQGKAWACSPWIQRRVISEQLSAVAVAPEIPSKIPRILFVSSNSHGRHRMEDVSTME